MDQKPAREMKGWTRHSSGALEMGVSVLVGGAIGYLFDHYLDTYPWMTLFWGICGAIAGFRSLYRLAKKLEAEAEQEELDKEGEGGDRDSTGPRG